jgi:phosphonate transport system substrate-binding protein
MNFKKASVSLLAMAMLAGCSAGTTTSASKSASSASGSKELESLHIQFVPSRNVDDLTTAVSPLGDLLKEEMSKQGYTIDDIKIDVSTDYNAAGEALAAGSVDIAWLPAGTYALYSDDAEVVLTATRNALSNDSDNPADWNGDANATKRVDDETVTYYKGLIYAAPTEKGKALAEKVNNGEELTWDELNDASWFVNSSTTSSSGYTYPSLWLKKRFNKGISDLANVTVGAYPDAFMQAANEAVDVIVCYADGRQDYEEQWQKEWGRTDTIWNELNVIGVTDNIYNDTVSVTKANKDIYNDEFIKAFQTAMINAAKTEEGKKIIAIYSHNGYEVADPSNYDDAKAALEEAAN